MKSEIPARSAVTVGQQAKITSLGEFPYVFALLHHPMLGQETGTVHGAFSETASLELEGGEHLSLS